jgi:hypothetical protein
MIIVGCDFHTRFQNEQRPGTRFDLSSWPPGRVDDGCIFAFESTRSILALVNTYIDD